MWFTFYICFPFSHILFNFEFFAGYITDEMDVLLLPNYTPLYYFTVILMNSVTGNLLLSIKKNYSWRFTKNSVIHVPSDGMSCSNWHNCFLNLWIHKTIIIKHISKGYWHPPSAQAWFGRCCEISWDSTRPALPVWTIHRFT